MISTKRYGSLILALATLFLISCAVKAKSSFSEDKPIAFPGAEGYGKYTSGGRGGKVYIVNTLDDSGEGSLREAVKAKEPRIVVFAVSGTIHLEKELPISGNVTIAGQTAPGDGICIADYPVSLKGDNIVIRYVRFRMGDKNQNSGKVAGGGSDDALSGGKRNNIIIDHCSMSWSTDEVASFYAGDSITLQWNIISEPLNYSYHFEAGNEDFQEHGYGGIWGGRRASFHHNLFAHCASRTPRFDGIRNSDSENVDYSNNVIYNWVSNNVYAGEGGNYNIVNNYYKYGPSTEKSKKFRIVNPFKTAVIPFGKFHVSGNYVDGSSEMSKDNLLGVIMNNGTEADKETAIANSRFVFEKTNLESAAGAYQSVMAHAGASLPLRDTLDQRVINDVKNRTGKIIDVQGGFPHGTAYDLTLNAWPALKNMPALQDSDKDGMPDAWEKEQGLDPQNSIDAALFGLAKNYTNIEVYINSLVKHK